MVKRLSMFDASRLWPFLVSSAALGALACGGTTQTTPDTEPVRLADGEVADARNGLAFPSKYKNWPVLSVNQRPDQQTLSVVVGNVEAVRAARKGQINPWPDGSVIGHLVFEQSALRATPGAIESGQFLRAEFMFKNVETYASNSSGWGWARWDGEELSPFGDEGFEEDCIACHAKVSGSDWLFSTPIAVP